MGWANAGTVSGGASRSHNINAGTRGGETSPRSNGMNLSSGTAGGAKPPRK